MSYKATRFLSLIYACTNQTKVHGEGMEPKLTKTRRAYLEQTITGKNARLALHHAIKASRWLIDAGLLEYYQFPVVCAGIKGNAVGVRATEAGKKLIGSAVTE